MLSQGYGYYYRKVMITIEGRQYCSHIKLKDELFFIKDKSLYRLIKELDKTLEYEVEPQDKNQISRKMYLKTLLSKS